MRDVLKRQQGLARLMVNLLGRIAVIEESIMATESLARRKVLHADMVLLKTKLFRVEQLLAQAIAQRRRNR